MKLGVKTGFALFMCLFTGSVSAAGPAVLQNEAKLVGAWQEGMTPQVAGWNEKQLAMAKKAGLLGPVTQFNPDHTFVMYPRCGAKRDDLRKAGLDSIRGTWKLTEGGDLISQVDAMGRSVKLENKVTWQDGQMILLNKNGSVAQKAGRYVGPLPPSC